MTNTGKKGQWSFIKITRLLASQPLLVLLLFRFKYMVSDLPCNLTAIQLLKAFLSPLRTKESLEIRICVVLFDYNNKRNRIPKFGLLTGSVFLWDFIIKGLISNA